MKFNNKQYSIGDIRTRKVFAFFPTRINRDRVVWLESYYITEQLEKIYDYDSDGCDQWIVKNKIPTI